MLEGMQIRLLSEPRIAGAAAAHAESAVASPARWSFEALAARVSELCAVGAGASLTAAAWILREAQRLGEPAAWVGAGGSAFYPPDLHDFGVDLAALAVVRVPGAVPAARACEHLLRSGAFGLVVLDLADVASGSPRGGSARSAARSLLPPAALTRLAALCRRHHAALICLARGDGEISSLGSFVSLRGRAAAATTVDGRHRLEVRILKDKLHGPGWSHTETCRAPDGLR